jgi:phage terminase Nu1 subunit (DNA packaging protein)
MAGQEFFRVREIKLTLNELGFLTDLDQRNLKKKLAKIVPENGPNGSTLYDLRPAVHAIFLEGDDSLPALKIQREKAETRLAEAKALKVELENATSEKELVPIAEVRKMYGDLLGNFRTRMLSIPSKAAFVLTHVKTPGEMEAHLTEMIHEALHALLELAEDGIPNADSAAPKTHD